MKYVDIKEFLETNELDDTANSVGLCTSRGLEEQAETVDGNTVIVRALVRGDSGTEWTSFAVDKTKLV